MPLFFFWTKEGSRRTSMLTSLGGQPQRTWKLETCSPSSYQITTLRLRNQSSSIPSYPTRRFMASAASREIQLDSLNSLPVRTYTYLQWLLTLSTYVRTQYLSMLGRCQGPAHACCHGGACYERRSSRANKAGQWWSYDHPSGKYSLPGPFAGNQSGCKA